MKAEFAFALAERCLPRPCSRWSQQWAEWHQISKSRLCKAQKSGSDVLEICLKARVGTIWEAGAREKMKWWGPNENAVYVYVLGCAGFPVAWCT